MVKSIIQDKEGFMWFATKDGLNKYDGYQTIVYRNNTDDPWSLPDNTIFSIMEDDNGNLWVGSVSKGLCIFDRKTERFYGVAGGGKTNGINDMVTSVSSVKGRLLVRTISKFEIWDISNISPKNYNQHPVTTVPLLFDLDKQFGYFNSPLSHLNLALLLMPNGDLWCSFRDSVLIFSPGPDNNFQFKKRLLPMDFGGNCGFISAIPVSISSNMVSLVNEQEIIQYNLADSKPVAKLSYNLNKHDKPTDELILLQALPDAEDNIWIKKPGNQLYKCNLKAGTVDYYHYLTKKTNGLQSTFDRYYLSFIDQNGIIWMGSSGYGILNYNPAIENFNRINGTPYIGSQGAFWADAKGNIITTKLDSFFKTGNNPGVNLIKPDQLAKAAFGSYFTSVKDNEGYIWAFPQNKVSTGLFRLNQSNKIIYTKNDIGIGIKNITLAFCDRFNNIWVGARDDGNNCYLYQFNKITGRVGPAFSFPVAGSFDAEVFIMDWWQNNKGIFWFGTIYGLFNFNPQTNEWRHYKNIPGNNNSLSENKIYSVCADPVEPEKYLWVGTNGGGLNRFEISTGSCTRYNLTDGLPNLVLYKMFADSQNNIWISTNNGISCFNMKTQRFRNFTVNDGLMSNEFNRFSGYKTKNNILYFGGVDGITWFYPAQVLTKPRSAPLVLTGFSTSGIAYSGHTDSTVLINPIRYNRSITLPYDKDMFSISFALLDFSRRGGIKYRYWLQGFNKNWIYSGTSNRATYTNMDPGNYIFRVAALGNDGEWIEHQFPLHIHISSPWWSAWWFKSLLTLSLMSVVYIIYRYRLQQKIKIYQLRNKLASDLHDEIGSTLSSIVVYSDIIRDKETDTKLQSIANTINISSRATLESMNDIIWSISPNNDSFDSILTRMRVTSYELLEAINCELLFVADPELSMLKLSMIQRQNLYLIFKEALNNITKYSKPAQVSIKIELLQKDLRLSISDDGIGFNLLDHKEGNGLLNMQQRAVELKGDMHIQSAPGKGCCIILCFPIG